MFFFKLDVRNYKTFADKQIALFTKEPSVFKKEQLKTMMSTLQPDESWKPKSNKDEPQKKQYEAQKALLDSRFLTTLGQIMQNKDMGDAIKNGKFDIISQSSPDFL